MGLILRYMKNKFISDKKAVTIVSIAIVLIGILLMLIPTSKLDKTPVEKTEISFYTEKLEKRITDLLLEIDGITYANVLITLENNGRNVYAEDMSNTSSEYVIIKTANNESGIMLTEITPEVRGVAVVCTNGDDISVKTKVTNLLSSALGIPTNKITIVG